VAQVPDLTGADKGKVQSPLLDSFIQYNNCLSLAIQNIKETEEAAAHRGHCRDVLKEQDRCHLLLAKPSQAACRPCRKQ